MKIPSLILAFAATCAFAQVERLVPGRLPPPMFADCEVCTNIAIATPSGSRTFAVELALDATPTNLLEVSVGADDAPSDSVLSAAETAFRFGWYGGEWRLSAPGLTNAVATLPSGAVTRKAAYLLVGVRANGAIRSVSLLDGGVPVLGGDVPDLPSASSWNMVRLVSRGLTRPFEDIVVKTSPEGTQLILR